MLLVLGTSLGHAEVITVVGYDSTNPNANPNDPAPDLPAAEAAASVVARDLARGPGVIPNAGVTFNSRNWSTDNNFSPTSDRFISWGWSQSDALDLTDMTLEYDRSNDGPESLVIRLSVNGGSFVDIFSDPFISIGDEQATIGLDGFDDVTSAEFRLYGFRANSAGGTLDIERFNTDQINEPSRAIVVRGQFATVPEPGSVAVLVMVGAGTWLGRRRRLKSQLDFPG